MDSRPTPEFFGPADVDRAIVDVLTYVRDDMLKRPVTDLRDAVKDLSFLSGDPVRAYAALIACASFVGRLPDPEDLLTHLAGMFESKIERKEKP